MSSLHIGQDESEMSLRKLSQSSSFPFTVKLPFCPTKGKPEHLPALQCHPQAQEVSATEAGYCLLRERIENSLRHTGLGKALEKVL